MGVDMMTQPIFYTGGVHKSMETGGNPTALLDDATVCQAMLFPATVDSLCCAPEDETLLF